MGPDGALGTRESCTCWHILQGLAHTEASCIWATSPGSQIHSPYNMEEGREHVMMEFRKEVWIDRKMYGKLEVKVAV